MSTSRAVRQLAAAGALVACCSAGLVAATGPARAADDSNFELSSEVRALDVTIQDKSLPFTQTVEASLFGSSARLSSTGVSKADAGAPYSPFGYSTPSTLSGLAAGSLPPLPPFPGYVAASHPVTPRAAEQTGGYELTAEASDQAARGEVALGGRPAGSSTSNAFARAESLAGQDGSVTVSGLGGVSALSFGQVFELGRVASSLTLRVPASGAPVLSGGTDLGTVTFAQTFVSGIRDGQVFAAGAPVPVSPELLGALNEALQPSGFSLAYLPPSYGYSDGTGSVGPAPESGKTLRSVVSGGLLVTLNQDVPSQGPVLTRYAVGRVMVSATNIGASVPLLSGEQGSDAPAAGGSAVSPGTPGGVDAATEIPAAGLLPNLDAGVAGVPSVVFTSRPAVDVGQVSFGGQLHTSTKSFYLLLAVGGLAAIVAAQVIRFCAVKR